MNFSDSTRGTVLIFIGIFTVNLKDNIGYGVSLAGLNIQIRNRESYTAKDGLSGDQPS